MRSKLIAVTVVGVSLAGIAVYELQNNTNLTTASTPSPVTAMKLAGDVTNMNPSAGGEGGPVPEPSSSTTGNPSSGVQPPTPPAASGVQPQAPSGAQPPAAASQAPLSVPGATPPTGVENIPRQAPATVTPPPPPADTGTAPGADTGSGAKPAQQNSPPAGSGVNGNNAVNAPTNSAPAGGSMNQGGDAGQ